MTDDKLQTIRHIHYLPALAPVMFVGFGVGVGELVINNPVLGGVIAIGVSLLRG